jgi:hypothetical protein
MTTKIRIPIKEVIFFLKEIRKEQMKNIETIGKERYIDSTIKYAADHIMNTAKAFSILTRQLVDYKFELQQKKEEYDPLINEFINDEWKIYDFFKEQSEEIIKMRNKVEVYTIKDLDIIENILKDIFLELKRQLEKISDILLIFQERTHESYDKYIEKDYNLYTDYKTKPYDDHFIITILQKFTKIVRSNVKVLLNDIYALKEFKEYLQLEKD